MAALRRYVSVRAARRRPPTDWIDPDTGHRVIRLSSEPGSQTLYFHDNAYSPEGDKYVFSSPSGIMLTVAAIAAEDPSGRTPRPAAREPRPQLERMFPGKTLDQLSPEQQYAVTKEDGLARRAINPDGMAFVFTNLKTGERTVGYQYGWSFDGKTVWFDLQTPRSQVFWIARVELSSGRKIRHQIARDAWSVHYTVSRDNALFMGDGGDETPSRRTRSG